VESLSEKAMDQALVFECRPCVQGRAISDPWLSCWDAEIGVVLACLLGTPSCKLCKKNQQSQFKHCAVSYPWKNVKGKCKA